MPIFEYTCDKCGKTFEELVFGDDAAPCPECGSEKTTKLISLSRHTYPGGVNGKRNSMAPGIAPSAKSACAGCSSTNCSTCK